MPNISSFHDDESTEPLIINNEAHVQVAIQYPFTEVKIYKRRWIILSAFAMLGFIQGAIWNTWGPISSSAKIVFPQWSDATIALISNWGNICFVLFLFPVIWVMETKGIRTSTLLAAFLVFSGAGIRCFTMDSNMETWLIHVGHIMNGIAGIVLFAGPPQVSAVWFPQNQRTTATGLIYVLGTLGIAVGSVIPPFIVDENSSSGKPVNKQKLDGQVLRLMYLQFGCAVILLTWVFIYFPAKPDFPPSITASNNRVNFFRGLKMINRNKDVWLVGLAYGISSAVYGCWVTVLHINLQILGIDQKDAGWIGCYSLLGGCLGTFITSRLIDLLGGKMKMLLIIGLIGATTCFSWFMAICLQLLPLSKISLYMAVILGGTFISSLQPIFIELGAEVAYPVGEAVVSGLLTGIYNVLGTIFLMLFFIPNIGYLWMNWCLIGSAVLAIPFVIFVKEFYARSSIDTQYRQ